MYEATLSSNYKIFGMPAFDDLKDGSYILKGEKATQVLETVGMTLTSSSAAFTFAKESYSERSPGVRFSQSKDFAFKWCGVEERN